jgi:hypothetical protein
MKLKDYIKALNNLKKKHPECLEFDIIQSSDDEGNSYQKANYGPNLAQVHDLKDYHLEIVGFLGDENIAKEDCNAVIIN